MVIELAPPNKIKDLLNQKWSRKALGSGSAGPLAWSRQRQPPRPVGEGLCDLRELNQGWEAEVTLLLWTVWNIGGHRITSADVHSGVEIYKKPWAWREAGWAKEPNHPCAGSRTRIRAAFHRKEVPQSRYKTWFSGSLMEVPRRKWEARKREGERKGVGGGRI